MTLTKNEMISNLTEQMKIDKKTASQSVEKIIETIKSSLESGDDVMISGFGKFCVNEKNERKGRNPATGENLILPGRKIVTFKSSGKLQDRVNDKSRSDK